VSTADAIRSAPPAWAEIRSRSTVDLPGAPDSISIIGCDAANGAYFQLYSDDRGV